MAELLNLNLIKETLDHFNEGARSVRAYSNDVTYVITKTNTTNEFWVAIEENPQTPKVKTKTLDKFFEEVFGVEARY